jgi:hypothetical protein
MTPTDRKQLLERLNDALVELRWHGPLAKFPLFYDVGELTPLVLEGCPLPKAKLAKAERKLGKALVQMVKDGDSPSLLKVVRTVEHFLDKSERYEDWNGHLRGGDMEFPEVLDERKQVLSFLIKHVDEYWTVTEIQKHLENETGVWKERKTLKNWCTRDYGFPIKPNKGGRPKKRNLEK